MSVQGITMKKLSKKPQSKILSKVKKPLMVGTVLTSVTSCVIAPESQYEEVGLPPLAGEEEIAGAVPFQPAGNEFIGAGDPNVAGEVMDMTIPPDIGFIVRDEGITEDEPDGEIVSDFGMLDMGMEEPDAELHVGLPPAPDASVDEPGSDIP